MDTNATTNHEHQWIFLGELLMTYSRKELKHNSPDIRRLEYCGGCSMARLHMQGDTWAVVQGQVTKEYLAQFESETSRVVTNPPPELTFKKTSSKPQRLGRGLSDLMREVQKHSRSIPGLFPAKPEKKN